MFHHNVNSKSNKERGKSVGDLIPQEVCVCALALVLLQGKTDADLFWEG